MSKYYRGQRVRNIYKPNSQEPFKLSRSKLELFYNCPRCFYNDRRLGIGQPPGYPFTLNSAVDALLKKEFDIYRRERLPHPIMTANGIDAIPFAHELLDNWRDALRKGIQFHHEPTNLVITGGIDDVWVDKDGKLFVVDYKATSKSGRVTIDADWQIGYRRQLAIYSWLFKRNGFEVNSVGFFVYANGKSDRESFDSRLEFEISLLSCPIQDEIVEEAVYAAHECLCLEAPPKPSDNCDFCAYHFTLSKYEIPA